MSDSIRFDAEFPDVDYETWKTAAETSLNGSTVEKRLVSKTLDGLRVEPLYLDSGRSEPDASGFPGQAPFTRGSASTPAEDGWEIRQELHTPSPKAANLELLLDLERGVSGVRIVPDRGFAVGHSEHAEDGVAIRTLADMEALLEGVHLNMIGAAFPGEMNALASLALLIAAAKRAGTDLKELRGTVGFDPIAQLAADGSLGVTMDVAMQLGAALASWTRANAPGLRPIEIAGVTWHEAGASEATELAFSIGSAIEYLRGLTANGLSVDDAAQSINFFVASGRDTFIEIAKLRALRRLWARVVDVSGGSAAAQAISLHARSSRVTYTERDPWVNMLRATSQTFAAAVAGTESLTIAPFDEAAGHAGVFSRRVARNTQLVLREESHLARVQDPAGGSYYLERLTDALAEEAWSIVQANEAKGGFIAAVRDGSAVAKINETRDERAKLIAKRKMPLTGVSEFPNIDEEPLDVPRVASHEPSTGEGDATRTAEVFLTTPASPALVDAAIADVEAGVSSDALLFIVEAPGGFEEAPRLEFERYAEAWEALRDASEASEAATGVAPTLFLANIGKIPQHRARAMFAQNLFQAAGVRTENNDGFPDVATAVAEFKASGSKLACICSDDKSYPDFVPELAAGLKDAGALGVFVAGRTREHVDAWTAAGVTTFVHMGCDALSILQGALLLLGIEPLTDELDEDDA